MGLRKMLGGSGGGRFRTATPISAKPGLRRGVAVDDGPAPVGMSASADTTIAYTPTAAPLEFATFNDFGGVSSSGPNFTTFTFAPGHVNGTIAVQVIVDSVTQATVVVTSTGGGGPWTDSGLGLVEVTVDETSPSPFDITATVEVDPSNTLVSGAANLFYV